MKKILIFIFISLSFHSSAQTSTDTTGLKMFDQGFEFYKKGNLDSAIIIWTELVDKKIGIQYDTYGNAFFNIPTLYWQIENYEKAKEWYKKVLASDLRDNDETGLLMEPHTNYKHKSAIALAGLYQLDSNYTEVLQWINKADTLYRYWGYEGSATSVSKRQAYMLEWKTKALLKLNKPDELIRIVITELICADELESFFSASEAQLIELIDKKSFKTKFDAAINQLELKKTDNHNWIASFSFDGLDYRIPISNVYPSRDLPHYWTIYFINENSSPDKQKIVKHIKEQSFYKRVTK